ncbi:acetylxylan esterase [Actinotalea sp.]|uniref:acetylxylan esterase n=1 Tax=Actinotalea sp. TaxID=1872145 RepID=UPI0035645F39
MPLTDLAPAELETYRPELSPPADLDQRWGRTLAEAREHDLDLRVVPVDGGLVTVDAFDVTFSGFGGEPVRAWYLRPAGVSRPLPAIVEYLGYGGGRGLVHERLFWPSAGFAYLCMDTRGQGSAWGGGGSTPDLAGGSAGAAAPSHPGFLTRGVLDFDTYYYRRLITDAVRAVDAVRVLPGADADLVTVTGVSQGGALTLAAAGLADGLVAAMPDVPFLCHVRRAVDLADSDPYAEVARYLAVHRGHVEQVFRTLSYVDGVHLGARAHVPALFSVGLMDPICPPSTVYAAFHAYGGTAEIEVYPYNGHEGGQAHHEARQLHWLRTVLGHAQDD